MTSPRDPELQDLQRQNEALDEQIKLLVQTEQRQYRLQTVISRQLEQIKAVNEFALEASRSQEPAQIARGAVEILSRFFDVDVACIGRLVLPEPELRLTSARPEPACERTCGPVSAALASHLSRAARESSGAPAVVAACEHTRALLAAAGVAVEDEPAQAGFLVCRVLLGADASPFGFLLARSPGPARRSYFREPLSARHLPYIQLLANHVEVAIQTATMNMRLRARSEELSIANARLIQSMQQVERTQEQLLQSQKMDAVGRLAGGIAHDFNNLLTVILSHADLLESTLPTGEAREDASRIKGAATRAAKITNQLLAVSRRQARSPEIVDVDALVRQMADMLRPLIGEHITLELRTGADSARIKADPAQLEQVVLNLVVNARDAMPSGGHLTLETRPASATETGDGPAATALCVRDNGCGMSPETQARIFEPFFTTKAPGQGTGLGLATVYGLVEQNRGTIAVTSELDKGTEVRVTFPTTEPEPEAPCLGVAHDPEPGPASILLAEDEPNIRELAARILRDAGYSVRTARDGVEGMALASEQGAVVDLLLTDVVMPGRGGLELWRHVRGLHPKARVLFMSGYSFDDQDEELVANGLHKPFLPDALLRAVRERLVATT